MKKSFYLKYQEQLKLEDKEQKLKQKYKLDDNTIVIEKSSNFFYANIQFIKKWNQNNRTYIANGNYKSWINSNSKSGNKTNNNKLYFWRIEMKNILRKVMLVLTFTLLLTTANCFAYTEESNVKNENMLIKTYTVNKDEELEFLSKIQKEYSDEEYNYKLEKQDKSGGDYSESKDISTTKTITLKTNNTQDILQELPETIDYNESEFIGQYIIDTDSLKVVTNYNGYTEHLVEDVKEYKDLSRNDLDFIPKQVLKNGIKLNLLKVDWVLQTTKMIGDYEIADKYIAKCYYAGKIKKDNPYTYTITATYKGTATKTIQNPYTYTLTYSKEKITNNSNLLYMVGGSALGVIAIFFIIRKNAKVYNYKNGEYKFIGRIYIRKDKINLSRFAPFEKSNKYKIIIDNRKIEKLNNKMITIVKGKNSVSRLFSTNNNIKPYAIEVTI